MRIAVYGAGGVGGYFGGRLAHSGEEVIFIARGEHLKAMQTEGLRVDSIKGEFIVKPVQATDDPRRVGQVDAILVAVKAWQVPEAALAMRPMIGDETVVLPLQNGVDAPVQLASAVGIGHVLGGLCHISAYVAAPGLIRHPGIEPRISLGELDGRVSERVRRLARTLEQAEIKTIVPDDIQAAMWEKFLFIASFSGVGALSRAPIGILRSQPETRQMLEQAMHEIVKLARARRVSLPDGVIEKTLDFIDTLDPSVTASMQRDILDGRPSELGSQNGAVVRMALEAGIQTPLHVFIYHSLLPQELRARGELQF